MISESVPEADRLKAVERVRRTMVPLFGGTPTYFKRKRGIYRALKRGDPQVTMRYQSELGMLGMMRTMSQMFYGAHYKMATEILPLSTLVTEPAAQETNMVVTREAAEKAASEP